MVCAATSSFPLNQSVSLNQHHYSHHQHPTRDFETAQLQILWILDHIIQIIVELLHGNGQNECTQPNTDSNTCSGLHDK